MNEQEARVLVDGCNTRAKARSRKRKRVAACFSMTLTSGLLTQMYSNQNHRCALSGVVLNPIRSKDWAISVDRINNDLGYTPDNVRLVAAEFQHAHSWTKEKIQDAKQYSLLKGSFAIKVIRKMQNPIFRMIKVSMSHLHRHSKRTPRIAVKLGYDDLIRQYVKQEGRCFYSNIPMTACHDGWWQMSLERLDQEKGYEPYNVVWICLAFQTPKQWSREKFLVAFF
jgi:hypothetical protein